MRWHSAALQRRGSLAVRPARGARLFCTAMAPPKQQMLVSGRLGRNCAASRRAKLARLFAHRCLLPAAHASTATSRPLPCRFTCRHIRLLSTGWQFCGPRTLPPPSSAQPPAVSQSTTTLGAVLLPALSSPLSATREPVTRALPKA